MELRHLRYFIAAAETENFTKAAESLFVSQPTLSVQIHQLEQELGTELFSRAGRNVRLTQAGRVFLQRAQQAVRELEEGSQEVDAIKGVIRGTLNVGALPMFGSRLVSHWFIAFNERYPNVRVHGKSVTSEDLETGILNGTIDIGFGISPLEHAELNWRDLFDDEIVVIVSRHHAIGRKGRAEVDDLRQVSLALPSSRLSSTQALGVYFEHHQIQPHTVVTYDDGHALVEIVRSQKFISFLPRWVIRGYDDLTALPMPEGGIPIKAGAVWTHLSPAAKAFLDIAAQLVETQI